MTQSEQITVRVLKYDGAEHRRWPATLSRRDESLLILDAQFEEAVDHDLLGRIGRGTRTVEYYWLDRWYNVFRFLETDGSTRLYYCNVNVPPVLSKGTLTYIDLDIDILVRPDLSYQVLDLEEFEANSVRFEYPQQVKAETHTAVANLISLIATRQFPFS